LFKRFRVEKYKKCVKKFVLQIILLKLTLLYGKSATVTIYTLRPVSTCTFIISNNKYIMRNCFPKWFHTTFCTFQIIMVNLERPYPIVNICILYINLANWLNIRVSTIFFDLISAGISFDQIQKF